MIAELGAAVITNLRALASSTARFLTSTNAIATRARERSRKVKHWIVHWFVNILIGFGIELLLYIASGNSVVVGMKNWAMDTAMRGNAAIEKSISNRAPSILMIDIDEETWRSPAWGNGPYRAPRDALFNLIQYAVKSGASSVFVDVTIEEPHDSDDQRFRDDIARLIPRLHSDQHIIFVKTARRPLFFADQLAPAWQPSVLDTLVSGSGGKLLYAAPYFEVSTDGVVRSWLLWKAGCETDNLTSKTGTGHWKVVPSAQLVLYLIQRGRDIDQLSKPGGVCLINAEAIGAQAGASPDSGWLHESSTLFGNIEEKESAASEVSTTHRFDPSSRIFYQEKYPPQTTGIDVITALKVLQNDSHVPNSLDGRIVVIGQSSEAARDWHATPLGSMPGSMIVGNAIQSLLAFGPIKELPSHFEWATSVILIFIIGLLFALADSWIGGSIILITFVPILIFTNLILLKNGYWFEFSVPLLAMYVHTLISNFEEYLEYRKWRNTHAADHTTHHSGE